MRPLPVTLVLRSPGGGGEQGPYLDWAVFFRDTGRASSVVRSRANTGCGWSAMRRCWALGHRSTGPGKRYHIDGDPTTGPGRTAHVDYVMVRS